MLTTILWTIGIGGTIVSTVMFIQLCKRVVRDRVQKAYYQPILDTLQR